MHIDEWLLLLLLMGSGVGIILSVVIGSLWNGISPMPTSSKAKYCLFEALPLQIDGKIYELGSGWGRL